LCASPRPRPTRRPLSPIAARGADVRSGGASAAPSSANTPAACLMSRNSAAQGVGRLGKVLFAPPEGRIRPPSGDQTSPGPGEIWPLGRFPAPQTYNRRRDRADSRPSMGIETAARRPSPAFPRKESPILSTRRWSARLIAPNRKPAAVVSAPPLVGVIATWSRLRPAATSSALESNAPGLGGTIFEVEGDSRRRGQRPNGLVEVTADGPRERFSR